MKVIPLHHEEQKLIQLAIENNRQAQQQLYSKFSSKMLGVCRQYIKDIHQAEDVMITAFMKVFVNLRNFEHKGSFEGWIRRIMVNECLTFLRSNKTLIYVDDTRVANYDEVDDEVDNEWLDFNVQDVLDQLSEPYRLVFNLHILEDYSHQEIADLLNISVSTSKTQLFRAKAKLKEIVLSQKRKRNEKEG